MSSEVREIVFQAKPGSGYTMLFVVLIALPISFLAAMVLIGGISTLLIIVWLFLVSGFVVVQPNESRVMTLFGVYKGTLTENGFFWVNPFFSKKSISLRANNLEGKVIKVNDKHGNPIEIAAVVVWKVEDTAKAAFDVEDYHQYVMVQSEAALRHLAVNHSYDYFGDNEGNPQEISLKDGGEIINHMLEDQLRERLERSGVAVLEARIAHLAYAPEVASIMLQRQQAMAIVAARTKIVEGAVGMVDMALSQLEAKKIVRLDDAQKAAMVSNLLVVLCSDRGANPVVNAGN